MRLPRVATSRPVAQQPRTRRGRRRGHSARRRHASCSRSGPQARSTRATGNFPAARSSPASRRSRALARELHEELGIDVERAYPWLTRDYDYAHAAVRLRFFRVTRWSGELHGRENQRVRVAARRARSSVAPLLPANGPILRALALPHRLRHQQCGGGRRRRVPAAARARARARPAARAGAREDACRRRARRACRAR